MSEWNTLLTELSKANSQKQFNQLFDQVYKNYPQATAEDRVKVWLALEDRQEQLKYLANAAITAAQKTREAIDKNARPVALQALSAGIIADAILDGRLAYTELETAQDSLAESASQLGLDLAQLGKKLETPAVAFLNCAEEYSQQGKWALTTRLKMKAAELDPTATANMELNVKTAPVATATRGERFKEAKRKSQIIEAQHAKVYVDRWHLIGTIVGLGILIIGAYAVSRGIQPSKAELSSQSNEVLVLDTIPLLIFTIMGIISSIFGIYLLWKRELVTTIPITVAIPHILPFFSFFRFLVFFKHINWKGAPAIVCGAGWLMSSLMWLGMCAMYRRVLPAVVLGLKPITSLQFFHWFLLGMLMWFAACILGFLLSALLPKYR